MAQNSFKLQWRTLNGKLYNLGKIKSKFNAIYGPCRDRYNFP